MGSRFSIAALSLTEEWAEGEGSTLSAWPRPPGHMEQGTRPLTLPEMAFFPPEDVKQPPHCPNRAAGASGFIFRKLESM